MYVEKEENSVC